MVIQFILGLFGFILVFAGYVWLNDRKLNALPREAAVFSPRRWTESHILETAQRLQEKSISVVPDLPPRTGRRYIVVGGAGFLGGWIVRHLLERGEDPQKIRVLDIRPPIRKDLTSDLAAGVDFRIADVANPDSIHAEFTAPWPDTLKGDLTGITVFHTAANIRFFERLHSLLPLSTKVNVDGTRNVIAASRTIGADVLVYTSSGSISVKASRFWLWPWERQPTLFIQVINDDDNLIPKRHEDFFSNYAASKHLAESDVRCADGTPSGRGVLRTGCIRPGNGIYGPGGDLLCGAYLVRRSTPSWIPSILQNFVYVENCSLSHLCYEQRLIELVENTASNPDIGGQAYEICDAGPPVTYGDVYKALSALTGGETTFPILSPTAMLLLAHFVELYYLSRFFLSRASFSLYRTIGGLLPPVNSDLINLQPSLWSLTQVHLIFDSSRAQLPPQKGGLGYAPKWTTLEGICKLVDEHKKGYVEERQMNGESSVGLGSGIVRAEIGVEKVGEKLGLVKD